MGHKLFQTFHLFSVLLEWKSDTLNFHTLNFDECSKLALFVIILAKLTWLLHQLCQLPSHKVNVTAVKADVAAM